MGTPQRQKTVTKPKTPKPEKNYTLISFALCLLGKEELNTVCSEEVMNNYINYIKNMLLQTVGEKVTQDFMQATLEFNSYCKPVCIEEKVGPSKPKVTIYRLHQSTSEEKHLDAIFKRLPAKLIEAAISWETLSIIFGNVVQEHSDAIWKFACEYLPKDTKRYVRFRG